MRRAHLLLAAWAIAAAQAQQPQAKDAGPAVLALGACANAQLSCERLDAQLRLDEAVERAQPAPHSALSWTVMLRYRDAKWLVQVVDLTKPHANFALCAGDAVWIGARPAPEDRALAIDVAMVAAVRAMLATPEATIRPGLRGLADERRPPLLVWLLTRSADRADRHDAAQELARLPARALAVRSLVSVLDLDPSIAREAVVALGTMGKYAAPALPELKRLLDHRDANLRVVTAAAIRQIESPTK